MTIFVGLLKNRKIFGRELFVQPSGNEINFSIGIIVSFDKRPGVCSLLLFFLSKFNFKVMYNFSEIWSSFGVFGYFLVALVILFMVYLFILIYRCVVVMKKEEVNLEHQGEGVSIIITANNRAEYLKENLEAFLTQDYYKYEVIVVDECSEDETQDVLSKMQQQYPHLKTTRIFPETKFKNTKKIAINIGVLAAQYDILLFSEINCRPASSEWVKTMCSYFDEKTAVVLSLANYVIGSKNFGIRRYFRFLRFLEMTLAVKNHNYVLGEGCNMAYRKKLYITNRGYKCNSQYYLGYDNEMVKELSAYGTVKVAKNPNAYVNINDSSKKSWIEDITYYYTNKRALDSLLRFKLNFRDIIKILFYLLAIALVVCLFLTKYIIILILLAFLIDFIIINVLAKHLGQRNLFLTSFVVSTIGYVYRGYYNFYSLFNGKKWK